MTIAAFGAEPREIARMRFFEAMRRHIHDEDHLLSTDALIRKAFQRYEYWRGVPLIDPNE